ncbi:MAG: DnaJ C-terminal domain-containing protein [Ginsengibacter sp.]
MEFVDYYKILGVDKKATEVQIKSAYRKLARKHHPDLNPNDKEAHKKFQQINEANEVLSDPEKRKKYDQHGKDWQHADQFEKARNQQGGQGNYDEYGFSGTRGNEDFSDFFSSLFGNSGRSRQTKFRGQDYNAELHVTLTSAYKTHQQTITVNGKNLRITIPAGIENGQVIKLKEHGAPGVNGGPMGDLYITFVIDNNTMFKRDKIDVHTIVKIDLYTAVLGGEITLDTLSGKIKLKVTPEMQNGTKIRLKGKGFPVYKQEGIFGDMFITYEVLLPVNLTERQKELFMELSKLSK